jgi:hypothetical protein
VVPEVLSNKLVKFSVFPDPSQTNPEMMMMTRANDFVMEKKSITRTTFRIWIGIEKVIFSFL